MTKAEIAFRSKDEVVADATAILQALARSSPKAERLVRQRIEAKNDLNLAIHGSRFGIIEEPPEGALERLVRAVYLQTQASANGRPQDQEASRTPSRYRCRFESQPVALSQCKRGLLNWRRYE